MGVAATKGERADLRTLDRDMPRQPIAAASANNAGRCGKASRLVEAQQRRPDFASLRILMCGGGILLHTLSIFSAEPIYHLKSALPSPTASVLAEFLRMTTVPMFFVLAGWAAVASLRKRSPGSFVRERAKRLLVPLCVGGALFGSIIKYIELSHGRDIGFHGFRLVQPLPSDFFAFFPYNLMRMNQMSWSHLWFLVYLFLISVLLLPLLARVARAAPWVVVPAAPTVYLPALAMAALLAAFDGYWPYLPNLATDWTNFSFFALCFTIGAGIAAWPGFETRLHAETARLFVLMLLAFVGVILCGETAAGRAFVGLSAWGAIGAGLGVAGRVKPPATPVFAYLNEASLPVYIVHHVPVLMLGIVVLPLGLPVWLKIALIGLPAGVITLAAYHWLIRPRPLVRRMAGLDAGAPASP